MYAVIDVPSNLGLSPSGVEGLPAALRRAGLLTGLRARDAGNVRPAAPYDPTRSQETGLLNGPALRDTSHAVAHAVAAVLRQDEIPIVLAGDCSIFLGALLGTRQAMRASGVNDRIGLLFIDGHVDFYQPGASPTGEVADMDLALATGRGPAILAALDGPAPLVRDEDVVAVGARDAYERDKAGSQDIRDTAISLLELAPIRERGIDPIALQAIAAVTRPELSRFWCHLDADVLDDAVIPAVDYRQPGGLQPQELATLLRHAAKSGRMAGLSIAIYNPALDPAGNAAAVLVRTLIEGLT